MHMQLDDSCIYAAFHRRAKVLSSLHMLGEGMVSQKFQPETPPPCPPRPPGQDVEGSPTVNLQQRHKERYSRDYQPPLTPHSKQISRPLPALGTPPSVALGVQVTYVNISSQPSHF